MRPIWMLGLMGLGLAAMPVAMAEEGCPNGAPGCPGEESGAPGMLKVEPVEIDKLPAAVLATVKMLFPEGKIQNAYLQENSEGAPIKEMYLIGLKNGEDGELVILTPDGTQVIPENEEGEGDEKGEENEK